MENNPEMWKTFCRQSILDAAADGRCAPIFLLQDLAHDLARRQLPMMRYRYWLEIEGGGEVIRASGSTVDEVIEALQDLQKHRGAMLPAPTAVIGAVTSGLRRPALMAVAMQTQPGHSFKHLTRAERREIRDRLLAHLHRPVEGVSE